MNNACFLATWQVTLTYWTGLIVLTGLAIGVIAWLGDWAITYALRTIKVYWRFIEFMVRKEKP